MSSFFSTSSSGSGNNANKPSSSSSGGGGWGTFLKQGLSTIESKLDTVLDMNVPIPGGSTGILTSFSPHATVLPSNITGSSASTDTPSIRQPPPQVPSTSRDDFFDQDDDTKVQDKVFNQSRSNSKRSSGSNAKPTLKAKDSNQDLRKSASTASLRGSMDDSKGNSIYIKEESSANVDPFTGTITTAPGIKRMSTPPVLGDGPTTPGPSVSPALSATAAAAAANRERLEQRMRGIFKKSTDSPPTTPTPSTVAARSPAASPSPSVRQSISMDSEAQPQEDEGTDKGNDSVTDESSTARSDNQQFDTIIYVAKTSVEDSGQELQEAISATSEDDATKFQEEPDPLSDLKDTTDSQEAQPLADQSQVDAEQESDIKLTGIQENNLTEIPVKDTNLSDPRVDMIEGSNDSSNDEAKADAKELEIDLEPEQNRANDTSRSASMDNQQSETKLVETLVDRPYTPIGEPHLISPTHDDSSVTTKTLDQDNVDSKAKPKKDVVTSDENSLKIVLEQREEQLFKVMQEQSSLLEKLRDLEDAKAADEALKVTKISGLEKIIEMQKKELEAARGSNLASQPKSIQKTLEEQRALLEDKDEQIKGLLAEGEVLSKKEFKNLTTIKGLRMKNIEAEKLQMDTQKKLDRALSDHADAQTKVSKLTDDNRALNDTIKSLHDINQRQNKQLSKMEAELAQLKEDKGNLQLGLDRARQELSEARKASTELSNQAHAAALEREVKLNEDLSNQIDALKAQHATIESNLRQDIQELRVSLSNREELAGEKEDQLMMEIRNLHARLEQTDNDSYELQEALDEARRPLLRQIEVLQNQQGVTSRNWDRVEKSLNRRVTEAEEDAAKAQERERAARDKLDELKSQSTSHEARLEALRVADTQLRSEINATKRNLKEKEDEARQAQAELARERTNRERAIEEAKEDAERKLRLVQQSEIEKLKQQVQQLQQRQGASDSALATNQSEMHLSIGGSAIRRPSSSSAVSASSPMLSGGPFTMGSSKVAALNNNLPANFDSTASPTNLDGIPPTLSRSSSPQTMSGTGAASPMGLIGIGSSAMGQAVAIERLNAMVRQLEGQVTFLGEQVRTANRNKDDLSDELVRVTMELEELQRQASRVPGMEQELSLLQERHKAALEMLGERTEEVQELKADLVDVKEALRDQISELLSQLEQSRRANTH
ncbi:hypothetical protein BGX27_011177 [Mortierella sp. AM989]|nr:hypothetical protein BGX27_011177 [Mortierella sp. AM989]